MAENWANGVPDEGRSPESGHRMAAEGIQFSWRGNSSIFSANLGAIWGMSAYTTLRGLRLTWGIPKGAKL